MRIAVASGKGGTGKTTVAVALAHTLSVTHRVRYVDCDVEAPNGHLFLHPTLERKEAAVICIPEIDERKCTGCGTCVGVCQFHALAQIGKKILVFPQLCHGCGSCTWNCPEEAIIETSNPIGSLESGHTPEGIHFAQGVLTISEPMPTPVIRQLKHRENLDDGEIAILDAPPGASCSVVETLKGADFVILVTESTPFGLHDLKQMVGIINEMSIKAGIVINRENGAFLPADDFYRNISLPVLMRIPYDRQIAEGIARGALITDVKPEYITAFNSMYDQIKSLF